MVASCLQNMSNRVIRAIARSAFMVGFPHLCLFTGGSPYESDMRKQRKVLKCFWSKVQSIPIGTNNLLVAELDDFTIQFLLWFWAVSTWLTTCYNHCHSGALDLVRNMSNRFKLPDLTKLFGIMLVECWTCVCLTKDATYFWKAAAVSTLLCSSVRGCMWMSRSSMVEVTGNYALLLSCDIAFRHH